MGDDEIYGGLPPHVAGDDTSFAAALSMLEHSDSLRARVYRFIKRRGDYGSTDDEIEAVSGQRHQTISARRRELSHPKIGIVVDSGERRATRSGRMAKVWIVCVDKSTESC